MMLLALRQKVTSGDKHIKKEKSILKVWFSFFGPTALHVDVTLAVT